MHEIFGRTMELTTSYLKSFFCNETHFLVHIFNFTK